MPQLAPALVTGIVGVAFSAAAQLILKRDRPPERGFLDDTPAPLSQRGSPIPFTIGRGKNAGVFAAADQREIAIDTQRVGGRVDLELETGRRLVEKGVILLNLGLPGTRFVRVLEGDRTVWFGDLTPDTTPSGTLIETANDGSFRIYWGDADGMSDNASTSLIGVMSRWPSTFRVVWDPNNRPQAAWRNYTYMYECGWTTPPLPEADVFTQNPRGVSAAQAVYGLLTSPAPVGATIPPEMLDRSSFLAMAGCVKGAVNGMWEGGDAVAEVIDDILGDNGYTLALNPKTGLLTVYPVQATDTASTVPEQAIVDQLPEETFIRVEDESKPLLFVFADGKQFFEKSTVSQPDDGVSVDAGTADVEEILLKTVTDPGQAAEVAAELGPRRQIDSSSVTLRCSNGAILLAPGMPATFGDLGRFRVIERTRDLQYGVSLQVVEDVDQLGTATAGEGESSTAPDPAATPNDVRIKVLQAPDSDAILVFRARAEPTVFAGIVNVSINGGTVFYEAGLQNPPATAGDLTAAYSDTDTGSVVFEPIVSDQVWADLTGDTASLNAGAQWLVVGDEIMYCTTVTTVTESDWQASTAYTAGDYVKPAGAATGFRYVAEGSGTTSGTEPEWPTEFEATVVDGGVTWKAQRFRLSADGVVRARQGTVRAAHAIGADVYVIQSANLTPLTVAGLVPGVTAHVKVQAVNASGSSDLSAAVVDTVTLVEQLLLTDESGNLIVTPEGDPILVIE